VAAAIHVSPECASGGRLGLIRDGDIIRLNATTGELNALIDENEFESRTAAPFQHQLTETDGRALFSNMRSAVSSAETGAVTLF